MGSILEEQLQAERRRYLRFALPCRAHYLVGDSPMVTTVPNLSQGGMLLGASQGLEVGAAVRCRLHAESEDGSVAARALVRRIDAQGAHVQFEPEQSDVQALVRSLVQLHVVPELELQLGGKSDDSGAVDLLARWYREVGRAEDGLLLFRTAAEVSRRPDHFYAAMARFILVLAREPERDRIGLATEALVLLERGEQHGTSPLLRPLTHEARALLRLTGPHAVDGDELARLQHAVRARREELYAGFSQLLADSKRLEHLKTVQTHDDGAQATPVAPPESPSRDPMASVLVTIRDQLEDLKTTADEEAAHEEQASEVAPVEPVAASRHERGSSPRRRRPIVAIAGVGLLLIAAVVWFATRQAVVATSESPGDVAAAVEVDVSADEPPAASAPNIAADVPPAVSVDAAQPAPEDTKARARKVAPANRASERAARAARRAAAAKAAAEADDEADDSQQKEAREFFNSALE